MPRAGDLAPAEAGADLEALCGRDGHHRVREGGFQFVEAGFAEARGDVAQHAGDGAAYGVLLVAVFGYEGFHALRGRGGGAADGEVGVDCAAVDCGY